MNTIDARPVDTERNDNLKKAKLFQEEDLMAIEQGNKPIVELSFSQQLGEYLERVQSSQYKTTVGELAKGDRAKITVAYFDGDRYGITHPDASERELKKAIEKYYIQKERRWGEWHLDSSGQPERGELNPVLRDHVSFAFLAGHEGSVSRLSKEAGPAIDIESEVLPTPTSPRPRRERQEPVKVAKSIRCVNRRLCAGLFGTP